MASLFSHRKDRLHAIFYDTKPMRYSWNQKIYCDNVSLPVEVPIDLHRPEKHTMTSCNENVFCIIAPLLASKGCWANSRVTDNFRRHDGSCDVTVMHNTACWLISSYSVGLNSLHILKCSRDIVHQMDVVQSLFHLKVLLTFSQSRLCFGNFYAWFPFVPCLSPFFFRQMLSFRKFFRSFRNKF